MGRIDRRKEKTKQRIVTAAMELIESYGFADTTMEQIAEEADIAKGTLYNYFPVKEAILSEWMRGESLEKNKIKLRELPYIADTRARLIFAFEAYIAEAKSQPELFKSYMLYQLQQIVLQRDMRRDGLAALNSEIVKLGQKNDELRRDLPADILEDMLEAIFIALIKRYFQNPADFQSQEIIEKSVDLFLHGAKSG